MHFDELFRLHARVNLFTNKRVGRPSCTALVEACDPAGGLTLVVDADDLADARLGGGDVVQLGCGVVERGMYFTAQTTVRAIDGTRVRVAYPGAPQKLPRRSHGRAPLEWPCTVTVADQTFTGTTVNVSASGVLLAIAEPCEVAAEAEVGLVLSPPDRAAFSCTAAVVRPTGSGRRLLAVRFLDLPEAEEMLLQLLVLRATARRYLRGRVELPCHVRLEDGTGAALLLEGLSENLSATGVLVVLAAPPPGLRYGMRGTLELRAGPRAIPVDVVEVIRCEDRGAGAVAVALNYLEIGADHRRALLELVLARVRDV